MIEILIAVLLLLAIFMMIFTMLLISAVSNQTIKCVPTAIIESYSALQLQT